MGAKVTGGDSGYTALVKSRLGSRFDDGDPVQERTPLCVQEPLQLIADRTGRRLVGSPRRVGIRGGRTSSFLRWRRRAPARSIGTRRPRRRGRIGGASVDRSLPRGGIAASLVRRLRCVGARSQGSKMPRHSLKYIWTVTERLSGLVDQEPQRGQEISDVHGGVLWEAAPAPPTARSPRRLRPG
jgi:hypothetical protein